MNACPEWSVALCHRWLQILLWVPSRSARGSRLLYYGARLPGVPPASAPPRGGASANLYLPPGARRLPLAFSTSGWCGWLGVGPEVLDARGNRRGMSAQPVWLPIMEFVYFFNDFTSEVALVRLAPLALAPSSPPPLRYLLFPLSSVGSIPAAAGPRQYPTYPQNPFLLRQNSRAASSIAARNFRPSAFLTPSICRT